jgi:hypothetical protein
MVAASTNRKKNPLPDSQPSPAVSRPLDQSIADAPQITKLSACDGKPTIEEQIRYAAFLKWEAAGRPPGDGIDFWLASESECLKALTG